MGNAAVGAINEAQWKAAQPSINQQAGAIVDSIIGDGTSSAGADELPPGYGEAWENGTLFGNAGLGGMTGSADGGAAAGDYSTIVTGDPSKGYPVPVNYTNDPAVINALYANTVAYVNYENQQPLTYLPPVPQDANALVDYNHALQHGLYPEDYGNTLSTINVVPTSEMQQDVAAANERQAETEQALSSWQGSFGGDLAHNAVTLLTRGGNDLIAGVESVKDVLTDRMSAEQAVTGLGNGLWDVGSAIAHPVNAYNQAVNGMTNWFEEPLDQQARDIGRFGIDTLVFGGAEGIATKGLGYIDTLAGSFGATAPISGALTVTSNAAARSEAAANIWQARKILAETRPELTATERNQIIKAFDLETFRVNTLNAPISEFRYYDGLEDGAGLVGRWTSPQWLATPEERIAGLALPNNQATLAARVTLQPGTTVFQGRVAPQFRFGPNLTGGELQTYSAKGPMPLFEELQ